MFYSKAYKHIFTSPSSVEREPKATRSGNARIHGMTNVTPASIAYVATQVLFRILSSCQQLMMIVSTRYGSLWARHQYFQDQTQLQILRGSTIAWFAYLKMLTKKKKSVILLRGGIGGFCRKSNYKGGTNSWLFPVKSFRTIQLRELSSPRKVH